MKIIEETSFTPLRKILFLLLFFVLFSPLPANATGIDEAENIRVYEESFRSVVNIVNSTVRYDAFYRAIPMEDAGAGVIVDSGGLIVTSLHLIDGALRLEAELFDGSRLKASVVGVDRNTDIALLKVSAETILHPIRFSSERVLKVGSKVLAIGNPFGLDNSLTVGIVSSTGRRIRAASGAIMEGLIQTDAATNPGSSGGPLLSSSGEMVGLNAVIFSPVPGSVGVGLAIPVSTIKKSIAGVLGRAEKGAYVPRVWLGLTGQDMDAGLAARLEYKEPGILVAAVFEDSPAYKAGLTGATGVVNLPVEKGRQLRVAIGGDYIVDIDGVRVEKMNVFNTHVAGKRPGDIVRVGLLRDGVRVEVRVTLLPRPRIK